MIKFKMRYTVKQLADSAGISVRTLHYYDQIGLLKPESYSPSGYRQYDDQAVIRLQQIMFFRELGFSLGEVQKIVTQPGFDVVEALQSHRSLLKKKAARVRDLLATVDRTISKINGEIEMEIKEYYQGFSDEQIERYRQEVRQRWGDKALRESDARVLSMGKEKFAAVGAEGNAIFQAISDNMDRGFDSPEVQAQIDKWRLWLEHFASYSNEALAGLGRMYSEHPEFAKNFREKYHPDLPQFLTRAIEYYCRNRGQ
jgi:MerR family transcriptional regulator, thiopeptide resistance regulator